MLPGLGASLAGFGGPSGPVVITQTANPAGVSSSSLVSTYSSVSIGEASVDRIVVLGVMIDRVLSAIASATIDYGNGDEAMNALTEYSASDFSSIDVATRLFYLSVPSGTSATFKITYSGFDVPSTAQKIAVYSVTGNPSLSTSGGDTSIDMDSSSPLTTGSVTIPTNGGFIAIISGGADTVGCTWANATEDIDIDAGGFRASTATRTTAGTATITCTGGSSLGAMAWMTFTSD